MRIVVNDIAASQGGALTILESFYRYVRDHDDAHEWVFLLGRERLEESENVRTVVLPGVKGSWLGRLVFDLFTGRRLINSLQPDVVLSLQNTYTYGVSSPHVVYVHQALPFQRAKKFSFWRPAERTLAIYQHLIGALIKQSIRHADHVIVQTKWMHDAIVEQVGISEERVHAVLPDLEDFSAHTFAGAPDAGAFFYPTADIAYKNNDCIYAACRLLRSQGTANFTVTMTLAPPRADPNVAAIGRLPRDQVLETLSHSTLVFPSFIETYGLPLAEARALGAIILAADLPYAREVLEGYANAHFFDPASPDQLASLMFRVITGDIERVGADHENEVPARATRADAWAGVIEVVHACASDGRRHLANATRGPL